MVSASIARLQQWLVYSYLSLLLPAVVAFILLLWVAWIMYQAPYEGFNWTSYGTVIGSVSPNSTAAQAGLRPGDQIVAINGVSLQDIPGYYHQSVGAQVEFTFERNGQVRTVAILLDRAPLSVWLTRFEPLLIGLFFWGVGTGAWLLQPFHRVTRLFCMLSLVTTHMLAIGTLSTIRWPGSAEAFRACLIVLAPFLLHFFGRFPAPPPKFFNRTVIGLMYGTSIGLALITVLLSAQQMSPVSQAAVRNISRIFMVLMGGTALVLLLRPQSSMPMNVRRQRRLLIAGMIVSIMPILLGSFLTELLYRTPLIPYTVTFPFLVLLPLTYWYALWSGALGRIDWLLNRSLVYTLLTVACALLYTGGFVLLERVIPPAQWNSPLVGSGLAVVAAILFGLLRPRVEQMIDYLFYGGWYDYRTVVQKSSTQLSQATTLDHLVCQLLTVAQTMRFQKVLVFWTTDKVLHIQGSLGVSSDLLQRWQIPLDGAMVQELTNSPKIYRRKQLVETLRPLMDSLHPAEQLVLREPLLDVWIPMARRQILRGLLVMGDRQGEEVLDRADLDILKTLAEQAAIAAENVALINVLRARLSDVERMRDHVAEVHQRLAESREAERLYLARELHDGPIQDLYGVQFALGPLAAAFTDPNDRSQHNQGLATIQQVIKTLRTICGELRPPTLAPFGLEAAIRSHAERFQEMHPEILVQLDLMHDGQLLSEQVRLALFRIYQELLNNVAKHARAGWVLVQFHLDSEQIVLEVRDDGCGFDVPDQLLLFARHGHIGLLGISERADLIKAGLDIRSSPGEGTIVRVVLPSAVAVQTSAQSRTETLEHKAV